MDDFSLCFRRVASNRGSFHSYIKTRSRSRREEFRCALDAPADVAPYVRERTAILFASLIRVMHMKCSNARDTWLSYLLLALLAANKIIVRRTLPGKTSDPTMETNYIYYTSNLYKFTHVRSTRLVKEIEREKNHSFMCASLRARRY